MPPKSNDITGAPQKAKTHQSSGSKKQQSQEHKLSPEQEEQIRQETSNTAKTAVDAQNKAKELTQAAAATGDPDERQKLLNEALQKEVEAENFGKTAKYLNSGAFQGLVAGTGLGGGIGVTLGTLSGTLVGGTTSLVTGGLGGAVGLGVGAAHGSWFKMGDMMGEGIRKVTGDLPGWKGTEEQKEALEKMVWGVQEQERPKDKELMEMSNSGGKVVAGKGYTGKTQDDEKQKDSWKDSMPSVASLNPLKQKQASEEKPKSPEQQSKSRVNDPSAQTDSSLKKQDRKHNALAGKSVTTPSTQSNKPATSKAKPQTENTTPTRPAKLSTANVQPAQPVKQDRQSSVSSTAKATTEQGTTKAKSPPAKKKPRKLEVRSGA